jgi:predicted HTH transcriptional regulator
MFQALEINAQSFVPDLLSNLAKHLKFAKVPRIDQKTMESALASAVVAVSSRGISSTSTPQQQTLDQSNSLPEECVKVLSTLAGQSETYLSAEELANYFGMSTEKMKYYLDILVSNNMVADHLARGRPRTYSVKQAGRKLLVESGLL